MTGYASAEYAATLSQLGAPRRLPRCGGSVLMREIAGTSLVDAMGPYPIFACKDWAGLPADVDELDGAAVAISLVTDPFGDVSLDRLAAVFPDLSVAFKEHLVVDLSGDWRAAVHPHHRRNARRALSALDIERVVDPLALLDDWVALYGRLVTRHQITGPAAFSRESFAGQLAVPGIVALRAVERGATVGATLWYVAGDVAYYHLGAYSDRGYELGASFALFHRALEDFAAEGRDWVALGAGAGAIGDTADGLTRFKSGWATGTRTAYLCGRVLAHDAYAELSAARSRAVTAYFPAYRAGEFA